jgi:hypothetical protein
MVDLTAEGKQSTVAVATSETVTVDDGKAPF